MVLLLALYLPGMEHPLLKGAGRLFQNPGAQGHSPQEEFQLFLKRVDLVLKPGVEIAYLWPEFHSEGLPALGFSLISARYQLQNRRIYPLLSPEELKKIEEATDIDQTLLSFLARRSSAIALGSPNFPVVVASWGIEERCRLPIWLSIGPGKKLDGGCIFLQPGRKLLRESLSEDPPGPFTVSGFSFPCRSEFRESCPSIMIAERLRTESGRGTRGR